MIIQWIVLCTIICFIAISYYKQYSLRIRLIFLGGIFIISLFLATPIFGFSILTLLGLFFIERIWILVAAVLFIEIVIDKKSRVLRMILGIVSLIIYLYLRTMI